MASLGSLLINVGANMDAFNAAMGDLDNRLADAERSASRSWSGFEALGSRLTVLGGTLTAALTAPIVAAGVAGAEAFSGFEAALNKVAALADNITKDELAKLHDQAIKLGADTQFSAKQAAEGMAELSAAGFTATQTMEAMAGMLDLAAAGQLSIADASRIATDAIAQFGLKTSETNKVADVLAKAAAAGKDSVQGLGLALSYAGGPAHAVGLTLEETVAALTGLANAGDRGEKAGTRLREILIRLAKPPKEAADALSDLGVKVDDSSGKMRPFAEVIQQLADKHLTLRDAAKIAGAEGASGLLNLVNQGAPALVKLTGELEKSTGAAKTMAGTLNSGLNGALEKMKGSVETAGIAVGEALAPSLIRIAGLIEAAGNKVAEFVKWFQGLPQPVKDAALAVTALFAVIGPLTLGLGLMITAATTVASSFAALSPIVVGLAATTVPALISAVTTFATVAVPAALTAIGELSIAMVAQAETSIARFATTTIPSAIAALSQFALTAIPSAIAAITTFATTTIPAAIASLLTFSTTSIPAATTALIQFATTGVAGAVSSVTALATTAMPALIGVMATAGILVAGAAAAFAGWKLGEWLYKNIEPAKKLGDAIADLIAKIPGVTYALEKLSGASDAQAKAAQDQAFATTKLAEAQARAKIRATDQTKAHKDLATQMDKVAKSLRDTKDKSDDLAGSYRAVSDRTEDFGRKTSDLQIIARKLVNDHAEHVRKLEDLRQKYGDLSKVVPELIPPTEELNQLILETTSTVGKHIEKVSAAEQAWKSFTDGINADMKTAVGTVQDLEKAFNTLGVKSSAASADHAAKAKAAYDTIKESGTASAKDLDLAWAAYEKARIDAAKAAGQDIPQAQQDALTKMEEQLGNSASKQKTAWSGFGTEVSTVITNLSQDLIKSLWEGGGSFGGKALGALEKIGQAVLSKFTEPFMKAATDLMSGVINDLIGGKGFGGIADAAKKAGETITGIFGGGASSAAGAAGSGGAGIPGIGGGAGGAGGGAGSGAGGASGGIGGIAGGINLVSGLLAAGASIFSAFQDASMAKDLGEQGRTLIKMEMYLGSRGDGGIVGATQLTAERLEYVNGSLDDIRTKLQDFFSPMFGLTVDIAARAQYSVGHLESIANGIPTVISISEASQQVLSEIRDSVRNDSLGRAQLDMLTRIKDAIITTGSRSSTGTNLGLSAATQGFVF